MCVYVCVCMCVCVYVCGCVRADTLNYNCVQRGHQNQFESLGTFYLLMFLSARYNPLYAAIGTAAVTGGTANQCTPYAG